MATFLQIRTRVEKAVIDLPTAVQSEVADLVNQAMSDLQVRHNFKVMEALTGPLTTTLGQRTLSSGRPADFKEFRGLPYMVENLGTTRDLTVAANREAALDGFGQSLTLDIGRPLVLVEAEPTNVAGTAVAWEVWPAPDGNSDYPDGEYRIQVPYWKFLPALAADGDSNWFTVWANRFLEYQATAHAFFLDWDEERGTLWQQRAQAELTKVIHQDKLFRVSGMRELVPHKGVNEPKLRF